MAQIGMLGAQCEHLTLDQCRVHVVVLQHNVLLETLDRIVICRVTQLSQQHLEEYIRYMYMIWYGFLEDLYLPCQSFLFPARQENENHLPNNS